MNAAINSTNLSNLIRYVREHKSSGNDNVYGDGKALKPLLFSLLLHIAVLVVGSITFSFTKPDDLSVNSSAPVFVSVGEFKQDKRISEDNASSITPERSKASEAPEVPLPPRSIKNVTPPQSKPKPTRSVAKPDAVPSPAPRPDEKVEAVRQKREEEARDQFSSMLKNLAGDEAEAPPQMAPDAASLQPQVRDIEQPAATQQIPQAVLTRRSSGLSLDEQGRLRDQLAMCWNLLPGAQESGQVVEIALTMNANATVQSARIVDTALYQRDPSFRALADSAMRAVRNPACNPLPLPLNKYDQWQSMTIRFDPREMF